MKFRIIIFHRRQKLIDSDLCPKFLADLTDQCFLRRLPRFCLSTREFPPVLVIPISSLCRKYPVAFANDCRNHLDRLLFHFCTRLLKIPVAAQQTTFIISLCLRTVIVSFCMLLPVFSRTTKKAPVTGHRRFADVIYSDVGWFISFCTGSIADCRPDSHTYRQG